MATKTDQGLAAGQVYTATHKGEEYEAEVKEIGGGLRLTIMDGDTEFVYDTFAQAAAGVRGYNTSAKGFWTLKGYDPANAPASKAPREAAAPKAESNGAAPAASTPGGSRPRTIPNPEVGQVYEGTHKEQAYTAEIIAPAKDGGRPGVIVRDATGKEIGQAGGLSRASKVITGYSVTADKFWKLRGA